MLRLMLRVNSPFTGKLVRRLAFANCLRRFVNRVSNLYFDIRIILNMIKMIIITFINRFF